MSVLKRAGILENFLFDQKNTSMSVQEVPKEAELQHLGICILTVRDFVFFVVEKKHNFIFARLHWSSIVISNNLMGHRSSANLMQG